MRRSPGRRDRLATCGRRPPTRHRNPHGSARRSPPRRPSATPAPSAVRPSQHPRTVAHPGGTARTPARGRLWPSAAARSEGFPRQRAARAEPPSQPRARAVAVARHALTRAGCTSTPSTRRNASAPDERDQREPQLPLRHERHPAVDPGWPDRSPGGGAAHLRLARHPEAQARLLRLRAHLPRRPHQLPRLGSVLACVFCHRQIHDHATECFWERWRAAAGE